MISAGEVGAVLKVVDEASPALQRIAERMDALQASIDRTEAGLRTLAVPAGLNRSLGVTTTRFERIADASKVTSDTVAASFARMDRAMGATSANMASVGRELKAINRE